MISTITSTEMVSAPGSCAFGIGECANDTEPREVQARVSK